MAGQRVYLDTNVFIFFLDGNGRYFPAVGPIVQACADGTLFGFTGRLAIAEVMVHPHRHGDAATVSRFKAFFGQKHFLTVVEHSPDCFDDAAMIAGQKRMKLIDAIHHRTALQAGCRFLLTNDRGFASDAVLEIVQIDDLL
jgi:predicted nucleic acid-binding protein